MASLPFGEAEAHGNNQQHENNFYRSGAMEEHSKEKICLELSVCARYSHILPLLSISQN
ncbi:hypothetical protein LJC12_01755 [Odoribacter sp. OttesenSCG-928-J03]|nr:hypothetical protein [Odoribacter sp. OttesenSCG-928-J03]